MDGEASDKEEKKIQGMAIAKKHAERKQRLNEESKVFGEVLSKPENKEEYNMALGVHSLVTSDLM